MADTVKCFFIGMPLGLYIILILCFLLLVASWIAPPLAAITPSALQGIALILGATWLFYVTTHIPDFIEKGAKIKASVGNATIEIGNKDKALDKAKKQEIEDIEKETEE